MDAFANPTKYDDLDFHDGPAMEAGQPPENGFTHIGFFLAWLVRHDLVDPTFFRAAHLEAVKSGEMAGSDLADDCDGKLISFMLSPEGDAFTAARYVAYLEDYERVYADTPAYAVVDDEAGYERIAPSIDALYAAWVEAGRPGPDPSDRHGPAPDPSLEATAPDLPWETTEPGPEIEFRPDGTWTVHLGAMPHEAPDLEALVPLDVSEPPVEMSSVRANRWGHPPLNRALKRLGVRPRDAEVASGFGGVSGELLVVELYRVPGVDSGRLAAEFQAVVSPGEGLKWVETTIGDRLCLRAAGRGAGPDYANLLWSSNELVVHVSGPEVAALAALDRIGRS